MLRLLPFLAMGTYGALPTIPEEYSAVIMMRMPYIPLEMPLRVLTSTTSQRIEYFNGLEVDTSSAVGTYKFAFNNSKRVCMHQPPSDGPTEDQADVFKASKWKAASFLPDLSQYKEEANEIINGITCRKFSLSAHHGNTGIMDDHMTFYWDFILNKPVRWHMHSRAVPFGSHTDEYIMDFLSFQAGPPSAAELALPTLCSERSVEKRVSVQIQSFLKAAHAVQSPTTSVESSATFDAFLKQHGKSYAAEEHSMRTATFEKNLLLVEEANKRHAGKTTFKVNKFMDMTKDEVMSFRGGKVKGSSRARRSMEQQKFVRVHERVGAVELPKHFDWRSERPGVVAPIKDQAFCGSCWTYGTIGPIESAVAVRTNRHLIELPEQFVLDCTWTNNTGDSGSNSGCDGGDSDIGALEILRKFGGIVPTAKAYGSYLSTNGYCKDIRLMDVGAKFTGWVDIKARDETATLQALVANGPLSVNIQVPDEMLYYDSGVLNVASCKYNASQIDHAVMLVGYGIEDSSNYYMVRNSWSTYWGDQGYIKIARGDLDCCVGCEPGYPEITAVAQSALGSIVI